MPNDIDRLSVVCLVNLVIMNLKNENTSLNLDFGAPLFLVGPPRSGTTLLQRLLIERFSVTAIPESHFYSQLQDHLCDDSGVFRLDSLIVREKLGLSLQFVQISGCSRRDVFEHYIRALVDVYDRVDGASSRVFEKTPGHSFCIDRILEDYPSAKIIVIVRDPVPSIMSACTYFSSGKPFWASLNQLIAYWISCASPFLRADLGSTIFPLRYEDLLLELTPFVEAIGSWADLDPRESKPNMEAIQQSIAIPAETWKDRSFAQVSPTSTNDGKPKKTIEHLMRIYIDVKTSAIRKKLGYQRGSLAEAALRLLSIVLAAMNPVIPYVRKIRSTHRSLLRDSPGI